MAQSKLLVHPAADAADGVGHGITPPAAGRARVFDGLPWAVYLPPHTAATIGAASDCQVALCSAPASGKFKARVIKPGDVGTLTRGTGSNARHVPHVLPGEAEAE